MATMIRATRKGGAVAHLMRAESAPSVCGRVMVLIPGGEGLRLCKTCARITGVQLDIDTRSFPEIPELSTLPALAPEWAAIEREWLRNGDSFTMGNARDVLTQYMDNPSEYNMSDAGTVRMLAKYRAYIKLHTGRDYMDPVDAEAPSTDRGNRNGGMVNPKSTSRARQMGANANQRGALLRMAAFADKLFSELLGLQGKEDTHPHAQTERYSDEFFDGLNTRDSIDKEFKSTSALIDRLKLEIEKAKQEARKNAPTAEAKSAEDGYYVKGDTFVCVKWNRAHTGQYATVWNGESWEYDRSQSYRLVQEVKAGKLSPMTPEDAKRFGDLYGTCFKCSRTLTDPESIAQGYGPVCAGKMGW